MSENSEINANNANMGVSTCAACKHQRKRCPANCLLAPHFPPGRSEDFLNVHRHFGVSNVMKLLHRVEPEKRKTAMKTIIFEAKARREDPVHGCTSIIRRLAAKLDAYKKELNITNQQLSYRKQKAQIQRQQERQHLVLASSSSTPYLQQQFGDSFSSLTNQSLVQEFCASSSSYPSNHDGNSCQYEMPTLPNMLNDYMVGMNLDQSFNQSPTIEEIEDVKPTDIKPIAQILDAHHHKRNFNDLKDTKELRTEPTSSQKKLLESAQEKELNNVATMSKAANLVPKKEKQWMT